MLWRPWLEDFALELILVRHGEQDIAGFPNAPVGDAIDPPLSARGNKQAEAVGLRFSTQHIDVVYSSNLERAHETGHQIARHRHVDDDRARRPPRGRGLPRHPTRPLAVDFVGRQLLLGIRQRMLNEKSWDVYPYSESSFDFRKRTVNAIEGILATHPGERIVVARHGGVINATSATSSASTTTCSSAPHTRRSTSCSPVTVCAPCAH
jgi:broad specificity phosphatase PhoE